MPMLIKGACLCAVCNLLVGCMTVRIDASGGQVRVIQHVGMLQIEVQPSEAALLGDLHGVGFVASPLGWTVGYTQQRWAAIGPQCRAILWVDGSSAVDDEVRRALVRLAGVCLLDEGRVARGGAELADIKEIKP